MRSMRSLRRPGTAHRRAPTATSSSWAFDEQAGPCCEGIVDSTVEELTRIPRPANMLAIEAIPPAFQDPRSRPVETSIGGRAAVIAIGKEAEGASSETMIAEAPTPRSPFVDPSSPG